eukprot:4130425-Ditylum_brightwellii.AAC.1
MYCGMTPKCGLLLKPEGKWNGQNRFMFELTGCSDSEYAKDESRRSVNRWSVFLCKAPISVKSKMMPVIVLSVAEAELFAAVQCSQDMLCILRIMNSMGLKIKLPM